MATTEHIGLLTHINENGNKYLLYPVTKAECVDGLPEMFVRNLLDNSDFTNPVNQRGFSGGVPSADNTYFIDRWMTVQSASQNISMQLTDDGLEVTVLTGRAGIRQRVLRPNTDVTFAIKINGTVYALHTDYDTNGLLYINDDEFITADWYDDYFCVGFTVVSTYTVEWAALYEGEYTAETLPPYVPKGYGAELAECMRYYQKHTRLDVAPWYPESTTVRRYMLNWPMMRITPTVGVSGLVEKRNWANTSATFSAYDVSDCGCRLSATSAALADNAKCYLTGTVYLSADL